jgi:Secretion system C-terminal sorting domain
LKQIILYIILFYVVPVKAQDILLLTPNPSAVAVKTNDLDVAAKASLTNRSTDTILVKWTRKIESITQGWSSAVCDKNFCYIPTIDTMRLLLGPNETTNMDIHIYPMGISGAAKITVKMEQVGKPASAITGTYLFNQTSPSKAEIEKGSIQLYPNPSQEYFMINSAVVLGKIELYNITGEKAKVYYAYKNKKYYIDDIPSGIYMARLFNLQEEIVKTVVLKKK